MAVDADENGRAVAEYAAGAVPTVTVRPGGWIKSSVTWSRSVDDRRDLADRVLEALHAGVVPWRHPANLPPEFMPLFGRSNAADPPAVGRADYAELDAVIAATGAKVVHRRRAVRPRCERPPNERIVLPPRSRFFCVRTYHAARTHEALHYIHRATARGRVGRDRPPGRVGL